MATLTKKDLLEAIEDMPMDTKIRIWDDCEGQWGTPYGIDVREFDGIEFPKGQYIVITSH